MALSDLDSKTIRILKNYLLFFVVFCHMNPTTWRFDQTDFSLFSIGSINNALGIGLSYTLGHISIPLYFLMSGLLFWKEDVRWSWSLYCQKIYSRIYRLLIPYVLWNALSILTYLFYWLWSFYRQDASVVEVDTPLASGLHLFWDTCKWGFHKTDWLGTPTINSGPLVVPLWYVRDLIVVVLLTPALFRGILQFGRYFIIFLLICYITQIWTHIPGLSIDAVFFFTLGLYISISGKSLVRISRVVAIPNIILSVVLFCICVYYGGIATNIGNYYYRVFALFGSLSIVYFASFLSNNNRFQKDTIFVNSAFFVYAIHACWFEPIGSVLSNAQYIMIKLTTRLNCPWVIYYLFTPFVVIFICMIIYKICSLIFPSFCALLSGTKNIRKVGKI